MSVHRCLKSSLLILKIMNMIDVIKGYEARTVHPVHSSLSLSLSLGHSCVPSGRGLAAALETTIQKVHFSDDGQSEHAPNSGRGERGRGRPILHILFSVVFLPSFLPSFLEIFPNKNQCGMLSMKRREAACLHKLLMAGLNSKAINSHATLFGGERRGRSRGERCRQSERSRRCV